MFTVHKRSESKSSNTYSFAYLKMTEEQLAQLAQLPRGGGLFGCVVLHSGYGFSDNVNVPLNNQSSHELVFSYQGVRFGKHMGVKTGEKPWQRGVDKQNHDVEQVSDIEGTHFSSQGSHYVVCTAPYFIRANRP